MKTILVVDDDIITRKVVSSICQELGYRVIESTDGKRALKALRKERVDIVISDWVMPEVNGLSLCEELHADPTKVAPFVFLMSARKKGLKNYTEALAAGADDFLYKPVDAYVFRNQLRNAEEILAERVALPEGGRGLYDEIANSRSDRR